MTRRGLITTTINQPTNLRSWADQLEHTDIIVVAGDINAPHDEISRELRYIEDTYGVPGIYVSPGEQERWDVSDPLGWRCIQRRSIALLEVLQRAPDVDYIITVDDDNVPNDTMWVSDADSVLVDGVSNAPVIWCEGGWYNAGRLLTPPVRHRGLPLFVPRLTVADRECDRPSRVRTGVMASLWLGDPDIDAVERIVLDPEIRECEGEVTLAPDTWCPFNSQATAFVRQLAPAMLMWPEVGRYDDIWASYLCQAVTSDLNLRVEFGWPLVRQERNHHDLVTDLERELFGMRHTPRVVEVLREVSETDWSAVSVPTSSITERVALTMAHLARELHFLPANTLRAFDRWVRDVRRLEYREGVDLTLTPEMRLDPDEVMREHLTGDEPGVFEPVTVHPSLAGDGDL